MANLSTFPTTVDTFVQHYEIQSSDVANVQLYQQLITTSNLTPDQQTQLTNLTSQLRDKLISADDINKLQDCITNLENFFLNSVDGYIQTKQDEWNAELQQFTLIGAYNPATTYQQWNTVTYSGESYLCLQNNTVGQQPNPSANTAYWAKIAAQGAQGTRGVDGLPGANLVPTGAWNSGTTYMKNQVVQYNGSAYYCLNDNTIGNLPTDASHWTLFISQGSSTQLVQLTNRVVLAGAASNVAIGISQFNSNQDVLMVFRDSVFLYQGTDYTIDANLTSIDIVGGAGATWPSGTEFNFIVFKNMQSSLIYTDGSMLQNNSVKNDALVPDAKVGSLATLTTTAKSDVVSAINEVNAKSPAKASQQEIEITGTVAQPILTYTPPASGNFVGYVYYRVVTGTTNVTVTVSYTDVTGAQTTTVLNTQSSVVGSYSCLPTFFNAVGGNAITINVTASVANQVYVSASLLQV